MNGQPSASFVPMNRVKIALETYLQLLRQQQPGQPFALLKPFLLLASLPVPLLMTDLSHQFSPQRR